MSDIIKDVVLKTLNSLATAYNTASVNKTSLELKRINGESTSVDLPSASVSVTQVVSSGISIATFEANGSSTTIYAPSNIELSSSSISATSVTGALVSGTLVAANSITAITAVSAGIVKTDVLIATTSVSTGKLKTSAVEADTVSVTSLYVGNESVLTESSVSVTAKTSNGTAIADIVVGSNSTTLYVPQSGAVDNDFGEWSKE